jgi:hypothetical protein
VPALASTSGSGSLAGLQRLAKSKIQTNRPEQSSQNSFGSLSRRGSAARLAAQEVTMQGWLAAILAAFNVANGVVMLFAGRAWWNSVPGVPDTGPFDPHFVQDVGAAFLVAGLALAARAWRPALWPAAVAGSGFLAAHAAIHLVMIASGRDHHTATDLAAVILPAALALYSVLPNPGERHA